MSELKNRILKLLVGTKIQGRYRKILNLYKDAPDYNKLSYHNTDHVVAVLNLFEVLRKLSGKGFDKHLLDQAYLAIVFHDINHCGHPDSFVDETGKNNIDRAVDAFNEWRQSEKVTNEQTDIITRLIMNTQYPLVDSEALLPTTPMSTELRELSNMIGDADMLWGMMPGNATQSMLGMWAERFNAGLETERLDILQLLAKQIKFINGYKPLSSEGRRFKNAMAEDADVRWAASALEYERQLELAELTKRLTDTQVQAMAGSIQHRHDSR